MKTKMILIVAVGFAIVSCKMKEGPLAEDGISGIYTREYSFKVLNPESGTEVGIRTVRDTVFIEPLDDQYKVSNHKWRMNDYDREGWRNMEHADDRSFPMFTGDFNVATQTITSKDESLALTLKLGLEKPSTLSWGKITYQKTQ